MTFLRPGAWGRLMIARCQPKRAHLSGAVGRRQAQSLSVRRIWRASSADGQGLVPQGAWPGGRSRAIVGLVSREQRMDLRNARAAGKRLSPAQAPGLGKYGMWGDYGVGLLL